MLNFKIFIEYLEYKGDTYNNVGIIIVIKIENIKYKYIYIFYIIILFLRPYTNYNCVIP